LPVTPRPGPPQRQAADRARQARIGVVPRTGSRFRSRRTHSTNKRSPVGKPAGRPTPPRRWRRPSLFTVPNRDPTWAGFTRPARADHRPIRRRGRRDQIRVPSAELVPRPLCPGLVGVPLLVERDHHPRRPDHRGSVGGTVALLGTTTHRDVAHGARLEGVGPGFPPPRTTACPVGGPRAAPTAWCQNTLAGTQRHRGGLTRQPCSNGRQESSRHAIGGDTRHRDISRVIVWRGDRCASSRAPADTRVDRPGRWTGRGPACQPGSRDGRPTQSDADTAAGHTAQAMKRQIGRCAERPRASPRRMSMSTTLLESSFLLERPYCRGSWRQPCNGVNERMC